VELRAKEFLFCLLTTFSLPPLWLLFYFYFYFITLFYFISFYVLSILFCPLPPYKCGSSKDHRNSLTFYHFHCLSLSLLSTCSALFRAIGSHSFYTAPNWFALSLLLFTSVAFFKAMVSHSVYAPSHRLALSLFLPTSPALFMIQFSLCCPYWFIL
jgi:hypothetical protein